MAKKPKSGDATSADANPFFAVLEEMSRSQFTSLAGMGAAWMDHVNSLNGELLNFLAARARADVDFQHALMNCRDPREVPQIHVDFMQKALNQYVAETGKLVEMNSAAARAMLSGEDGEGQG